MNLNERNDIGQLLILVQRDFHKRLAHTLRDMQVAGISNAQGAIITHLFNHGASRMIDIARANGIKSQSLLKVVNELESMRYVKRSSDPSDSRAKLIELTAKGRQHIEYLAEATESVWQQYADELGTSKVKNTFAGLRQIATNSQHRLSANTLSDKKEEALA